ncbi:zinc-binding domain-containing protein [Dendryphion nanum]|uniref:Zinc-binding domain-containing protein n=1 Tax=Dendryphion nanum TaxID=256645 RepID=A0A9P9EFH4_9PLEO|nr:zinc-binding domain-containing protein [Dendryphion nanum]
MSSTPNIQARPPRTKKKTKKNKGPNNQSEVPIDVLTDSLQSMTIKPPKPKKKSRSNGKVETRESFMFPLLHQKVVERLPGIMPATKFHEEDRNKDCKNKFDTNVRGKFICPLAHGWGSGVVATRIRAFPGNEYNAVVFNQRCKRCNNLGNFKLDEESYLDRVTRRLQIWAGLPVEQPVISDKTTPPHESDFCEGCKRGVCIRGRDRRQTIYS